MKIKVIGSGCPTCQKLYYLTQQAVAQLNLDQSKVEYSTNVQEIIEMGLMTSPILAIDGKPQQLKSHTIDAIKEVIIKANTKK